VVVAKMRERRRRRTKRKWINESMNREEFYLTIFSKSHQKKERKNKQREWSKLLPLDLLAINAIEGDVA